MVNSSKTVGKSSCRRSVLRQLNIPSVGILDTWAFPYLSHKTNLNKISITFGYKISKIPSYPMRKDTAGAGVLFSATALKLNP